MHKSKGVLIGYARVSSQDQDYAGQVAALEEIGCTEIFAERVSGKDKDGRPKLQELLRFARKGDTVHVTKLDRLARNAKDAIEIADQLQAKGTGLVIHDIGGVDINSDVGRLVYTVLAAVAEMERKRIRQRQREGIDRAKAEGRHLGRQEVLTDQQKQEIRNRAAMGEPKRALAAEFRISRTTLYKALNEPHPGLTPGNSVQKGDHDETTPQQPRKRPLAGTKERGTQGTPSARSRRAGRDS